MHVRTRPLGSRLARDCSTPVPALASVVRNNVIVVAAEATITQVTKPVVKLCVVPRSGPKTATPTAAPS